MKIRTLSLACVPVAAVLLVGCTAVYKNTDACEQVMRSKLADVPVKQLPAATDSTLSIDHRGTGIDGSRVVVEASLSRMQTAAEAVASAAAVAGAPAASATAATTKPAKPRKLVKAVAAECTFTGLNLASFHWLSPKELLPTDSAASEAAE